jgi:LacI family gluconate utilization system Gnt-I transcriptional repressor
MECQRRNIQVPEQVAIAGFGDYEVGAFSHPRITTVNVDCHGIGRLAVRRLIELTEPKRFKLEPIHQMPGLNT